MDGHKTLALAACGGAVAALVVRSIVHSYTATDDGSSCGPTRLLTPLKSRKQPTDGASDTVYLTGLSKQSADADVLALLSCMHAPLEADLSERRSYGRAWGRYAREGDADAAVAALHGRLFEGITLTCRLELGTDAEGKRVVAPASHNTVIRQVQRRRVAKQARARGRWILLLFC